MTTTQQLDKVENILKAHGFETKFSWAFASGYSDTVGMFPVLTSTKETIAVEVNFDHSPNQLITIRAGDTRDKKPKYTNKFATGNYADFITYLVKLLEEGI